MTLTSKPPTNFIDVVKNDAITSGGAVLKIGSGYIWIDATGDLRILSTGTGSKNPSSDLSGAVVGAQI